MSKVNELAVQAMSGFWFIILVNKVFPDLGNETKKNNLRLGVGAGIEPGFHLAFEKKFNISSY